MVWEAEWRDKARDWLWSRFEQYLALHMMGVLDAKDVRNDMGIWTPEEPKSAKDALSRLDELQRLVEVRRHVAVPEANQFQGPLYAVRCWSLDLGEHFLRSTGAAAAWESATLEASCNAMGNVGYVPRGGHRRSEQGPLTHGPVPAAKCQCGIHAYKTYDDWKNNFQHADAVGVVELEGRVQIHNYGYRAAKATMVAVVCVVTSDHYAPDMAKLREHYPDVPFMEAKAHRDDAIVPFLKEMMDEEWSERLFAIGGGYQKELEA